MGQTSRLGDVLHRHFGCIPSPSINLGCRDDKKVSLNRNSPEILGNLLNLHIGVLCVWVPIVGKNVNVVDHKNIDLVIGCLLKSLKIGLNIKNTCLASWELLDKELAWRQKSARNPLKLSLNEVAVCALFIVLGHGDVKQIRAYSLKYLL